MIQKIIYTVFVGILVAVFVGVGLQAFYPAPKYPEYPTELSKPIGPDGAQTAEQFQKQKDYTASSKTYNRNASIFLLAAAVLILALGLLVQNALLIIADGLMLGGVIILLYSVGRSFASEDAKVQFGVVAVGLIVAIALGFLKFVRPEKASRR